MSEFFHGKVQMRSSRISRISAFGDNKTSIYKLSDTIINFGKMEISGFKTVKVFYFDVISTTFIVPTCFGNNSVHNRIDIFVISS